VQSVLDQRERVDSTEKVSVEAPAAAPVDPVVAVLERLIVLLEAKLTLAAPPVPAPTVLPAPTPPLIPTPPAIPQTVPQPRTPDSVFKLEPANDSVTPPAPHRPLYQRRSVRTACLLLLITALTTTRVAPDRMFVSAAAALREVAGTHPIHLARTEPTPAPHAAELTAPAPAAAPTPAISAPAPAEPAPVAETTQATTTASTDANAGPGLDALAVADINPDARDPRLGVLLAHRADNLLTKRDILGARKFYEYAANAGNGHAALALAMTYNAEFLARARVIGPLPDPDMEAFWVQRATRLGGTGDMTKARFAALALAPRPTPVKHHTAHPAAATAAPPEQTSQAQ
jgi:hypothetical protein